MLGRCKQGKEDQGKASSNISDWSKLIKEAGLDSINIKHLTRTGKNGKTHELRNFLDEWELAIAPRPKTEKHDRKEPTIKRKLDRRSGAGEFPEKNAKAKVPEGNFACLFQGETLFNKPLNSMQQKKTGNTSNNRSEQIHWEEGQKRIFCKKLITSNNMARHEKTSNRNSKTQGPRA